MKALLLALSLSLSVTAVAFGARTLTCGGCGCHSCVRKVCRLICTTEEKKKTVYSCECEDFCVPGPSECCGRRCVPDCDACCGHRWETIWKPGCARVRTRVKLVKREVVEQVPAWKWEVVELCDHCCEGYQTQPATEEMPVGYVFDAPPPTESGAEVADEPAPSPMPLSARRLFGDRPRIR